MLSEFTLRDDEKIIFSLRSLYEKYGYEQYKMVKFEEYDLYAKNKEFLVSENIITFNDTSGKLMALKPDVTLSIIKNTEDDPKGIHKVYYNENVYRVSKSSKNYRELMQVGIECMGDVDGYCISETLSLAAMSLAAISERAVLSITDLDVISYAVSLLTDSSRVAADLLALAGEKNLHGISALCEKEGISEDKCALFRSIVSLHGQSNSVIESLRRIIPACPCLDLLASTAQSLEEFGDMIELDFTYSGDLNYYNGIVFRGYVDGVPTAVLSGGQYDRLMEKMGRKSRAIGFAVYLDELEGLFRGAKEYDVDTVLIYGENAPRKALTEKVRELTAQYGSVLALKAVPEKLRYRQKIEF
ncbi:MAG: ATP phosphoribosyltransferase regulatory subunit [Clostridia bacterium]|nr:ATP phosphoribosyltransferase regulatory subunit [Clostridia bacterium]